jgi:multisubunit Na+/H+ antiporter MnhC subunit
MTLDPTLLFLSLITSGIGLVLFVYGKKQERWPQLAGGLALMIYPYFVSTLTATLVIGAAIVAAVWMAVRQGW